MKYFNKLVLKIKIYLKKLKTKILAFIKKLIFPIYLFPLKLFTFLLYYWLKFLIKLIFAFISLIFDCLIYPFKGLKNLLKSIFIIAIFLYLVASLFVISDYIRKEYGWWGKFLCSVGVKEKLQNSVVRIIGGYSEGSGFFIEADKILTNFHVIADEPSPKIILPNGSFLTPIKIIGNKTADLALIFIDKKFPQLVYKLPNEIAFYEDEPLLAAGYALGTDLSGKPTVLKGNFIDFRAQRKSAVSYIQTNISLVAGMSGGPLVDQCGKVVGINTLGLSGLSLFINAAQARNLISTFTDEEIEKIEVNPSLSPEEAVKAFYTYLKARKMKEGFNLLSKEYLKKTNFEEWTNRFKDVLDVTVIKSERYKNTKDTAYVKFWTKNWVDGELETHYYEGIWQTVFEDGVYKILKGKILEVENPSFDWFF
jgi:hypothetical protein